jgi:uncharacterized CHY-type Zn-finger protein
MAERNNATCSICGKGYYMCMSCKDTIELHPFKKFTDTAEHYKIFQVVRGFSTGVYTKDEAKEKFKNIDLRDIESFRPHIKKVIEDILKEEKPVIKHVETMVKKEKPIVETDEKMAVTRKKSYKVEVE